MNLSLSLKKTAVLLDQGGAPPVSGATVESQDGDTIVTQAGDSLETQ